MPTDHRNNSDSLDSKQQDQFALKNDGKVLGYETEGLTQKQSTKKKGNHSRYWSYTNVPKYANPAAVEHEAKSKELLFQNKEFRDKNSCCICFDNLANAVIMNCGHGGICYDCGKSILESNLRVCHLCREPLLFILQMDLSYAYKNFINVVSATYVDDEESDEGENNE